MFTLLSMTSIVMMLCFYALCAVLLNQAYVIYISDSPKVTDKHKRETRLYQLAIAQAFTDINTTYNRNCVADENHDHVIAWIYYHQFIQELQCDGKRYTHSGFFDMLNQKVNLFAKDIFNQHTKSQKTVNILNCMYRILNTHRRRTSRLLVVNDIVHTTAAITIGEMQHEMRSDLIKMENKGILNPYYQFDITEDNYIFPIFAYIKKYAPTE